MLDNCMYYTPPVCFDPVYMQQSGYNHVFTIRVENSVDPDPKKTPDLDLQCFQKKRLIQVYQDNG